MALEHLNSGNFNEKTNVPGIVVVDFFATWCGPCKMLAPVLEQAADQMKDVAFYKVDIDQEEALTSKFGIMSVPTLLFHGEIEHIDSTGFSNVVRPGEVNLMIAGSGISHSEFSSDTTEKLHGVQLWYALPDALRSGMPESQHFVPTWAEVPGGRVLIYLGRIAGQVSPVETRVAGRRSHRPVPCARACWRPWSSVDCQSWKVAPAGVRVSVTVATGIPAWRAASTWAWTSGSAFWLLNT